MRVVLRSCLLLTIFAAALLPATASAASAPGIIDNGTVGLGVRDSGSLNVWGDISSWGGDNMYGLRLVDGSYEAISPGSPQEGWGFADAANDVTGWSNYNENDENIALTGFTYTESTALSGAIVSRYGDPYAKITHEFNPSPISANLYEIDVTIEPLQLAGIEDARYRRNVDWDIEPTPFEEVVTNIAGNAEDLNAVTSDGFSTTNPLQSQSGTSGDVFSEGPNDLGASFDFGFGTIPYGTTKQFKMYYGAASTRDQLLAAFADVDVETFSFAHSNLHSGYTQGAPATFGLGFSGVGGDPVLDEVTPTATITAGPPRSTTSSSAQISFESDTPDSTFECKLNYSSWEPCTSPVDYTDLYGDGTYVFQVRAIKDDKTQLLPAVRHWVYGEHSELGLYFVQQPYWWTSDTTAQFELGSEDVNVDELELECSLDGAPAEECDPVFAYAGLEAGQHTVVVTATHGSSPSDSISYSWTIAEGVGSRFTEHPPEYDLDRWAYFKWETSGDVEGVECKLDDDSWFDCSVDDDFEVAVTEGEHSFSIRAYDSEGQQDPITSWTWVYDRTAPTIQHNVPQIVTELPYEVTFTPSEPLGYLRCELDGNEVDCSDGLTLDPGLSGGWHELYVWYEDLAGRYNSNGFAFYVDLGATAAVITSAPPSVTKSRTAVFEFTAAAGATFECSLDESPWKPCTSPVKYDLLGFGESHEFNVRATKDGSTQEQPSWHSWRVTDRPFDLEFDDYPNKITTSTDAFFEMDADDWDDDLLDFSCSLDGGPFEACEENFSYHDLETGPHQVVVRASDEGMTEEVSYEWLIKDAGVAAVMFTETPDKRTKHDDAEFWWGYDADYVVCSLDGETVPCDEDHAELSGLGEGEHTFVVVPYDDGDEAGISDSYTWTVDRTAPVLSVGAIPANPASPYQVPLTANEEIATTYCSVDGDSYRDCGWPLVLTYLTEGQHTITVVAADVAGNESNQVVVKIGFPDNPGTPTEPAPPAKPGLSFNKPKAKAKKLTITAICPVASCKVSGWVKVGKKKYKLKAKTIKSGRSTVTLKFSKKLAKATKKAKKRKTTFSVSVTGGGQTTTRKGRF